MVEVIVTVSANDRIVERKFVMQSTEVDEMLDKMTKIYKETKRRKK